ncbi:MAG TPA: hypothetical protein VHW66_09280 [Stellaceae bacterium]|jgi:hypothetical protein|nr:hypothetical protein [Stellaceae bacterium]
MKVPSRLRKWALLTGLGALSPVAAQAAQPVDGATLRLDGDRVYLSEAGGAFQELALGASPEAQALRQMLAAHPDGVRLGPTMLAGSGGCGYHWAPADSADSAAPPASPPARKS